MSERQVTERLDDSAAGIARGAELLRSGATVAFPTETVYGLGANALDDDAVAKIYAAKERPSFNPLIAHLPDAESALIYAHMSPEARRVADAFWPGPLTLVLPLRSGAGLSPLVTAGNDSVALRVPNRPLALRLLREAGVPVAAPSANPSGRISPTTADHVLAGLDGRIGAVIDGGPCTVGVESTILGLTDPRHPVLLRPGSVTAEQIASVMGIMPSLPAGPDDTSPIAPGQMTSHYAPRAGVRLNATTARDGEVLVGFGPTPGADINLSPTGDLAEAAARLFAVLHDLDQGKWDSIAVAPIPQEGVGLAINDRLNRAAAPRPSGPA